MMSGSVALPLRRHDEDDVLAGLRAPRKHLPSRLLYEAGAELFEQVTAQDDYYPGRTELSLLRQHAQAIAHHVGPEPRVVEIGHVDGIRSRLLMSALERPTSYVPVSLASEQLARATSLIRTAYPKLEVQPVLADGTRRFDLPVPQHEWRRTLLFVPGSQIGSMEPGEARAFLKMLGEIAGPDLLLLLGADGTRDRQQLDRAYDDESGVTAAFDKRVLAHLNATRRATFDVDAFDHQAVWNEAASRMELHLVSRVRQTVLIDDTQIGLAPGEAIVTEHHYKHTPVALQALLATAGWRPRHVFTATSVPYRLWLCEPLTWTR